MQTSAEVSMWNWKRHFIVIVTALASIAGTPSPSTQPVFNKESCFSGTIGHLPVHIVLSPAVDEADNFLSGNYSYTHKRGFLQLEGAVDHDRITLYETDVRGFKTGEWHGHVIPARSSVTGEWIGEGGKTLEFSFHKADLASCHSPLPLPAPLPVGIDFEMSAGKVMSKGSEASFTYPIFQHCAELKICTKINKWVKTRSMSSDCERGSSSLFVDVVYANPLVLSLVASSEINCDETAYPSAGDQSWVFDMRTGDLVDWSGAIASGKGEGARLGRLIHDTVEERFPLTRGSNAKGPCRLVFSIPDVIAPTADGLLTRDYYPHAAKVCDSGFEVVIPYAAVAKIADSHSLLARLAEMAMAKHKP